MTARGIETVRPDAELEQVAEVMERAQVRRVPVVARPRRFAVTPPAARESHPAGVIHA